ncbi:MAG TPA: hypothetical protein VLR52_02760 [Bacteroidales bacterium]|nr:hypothetical protein [Bacteroidales bacterium]
MREFYRIFLLFVMCLPASRVMLTAQPGPLRGRIVDEFTGKSVEYGIVLNYSRHSTLYSSSTGEFFLQANPGDTLVLSAIGYYYRKIIVTDSLLTAAMPVKFVISPRAFEIGEAKIVPLGTYDQFRQNFVNLNKPKTKAEMLTEQITDWSKKAGAEGYEKYQQNRVHDGVTILSVPIRSPEEKERIALAKIMEKENMRSRIYQKFNPDVIKKVTGITEDHEVIEFMVYCDFDDQYVLDVNEYTLMEQIALRYELFRKKKRAEQAGQNPVNMNSDNLINPPV